MIRIQFHFLNLAVKFTSSWLPSDLVHWMNLEHTMQTHSIFAEEEIKHHTNEIQDLLVSFVLYMYSELS